MIDRVRGELILEGPDYVVVDVGGIGYRLVVPQSTRDNLQESRGTVCLLTHLHVREDALLLYGFSTEGERELFRALIGVSGIGPRIALAVLSTLSPGQTYGAIRQGDISVLTTVPGIGKKTAERLVLELRSQAEKAVVESIEVCAERGVESDALDALASLGYTRRQAHDAIRRAYQELGEQVKLDDLIRRALRYVS
ncbi:MAG: Holliday junction branch migration protein RuvA [Limnochordia bacterium]|jgi:Holliday junction DNA helicase RuvA|nr:Holliday junction branch migration protein RuvA [Limnochordia bacterium]